MCNYIWKCVVLVFKNVIEKMSNPKPCRGPHVEDSCTAFVNVRSKAAVWALCFVFYL